MSEVGYVVATGKSGASVVEFVHEADVETDGIKWKYLTVTYALRYSGGSYESYLGSFGEMFSKLKAFEALLRTNPSAENSETQEAVLADDFIGSNSLPVDMIIQDPPLEPPLELPVAFSRGPKF